jgi:general nucleoside transport system ATP-binding protein
MANVPQALSGAPVPRLELRGIIKAFPGCLANDAIDLTVMPGEIHALLGENGAGKSTLVKIIYGVLEADRGELLWEGAPAMIANPAAARALGIFMVFQHFTLFESLTVAENIALGASGGREAAALTARLVEVSERYGLSLDPRRHIHDLSVGERQRVEIVRCLLQSPRLLVMDEPTSVLTPQEAHRLFETLRQLAADGCSILYISHKLEEIQALCHRATILRGGRVVGECDPRQESTKSLARMMVGADLPPPTRPAAARASGDALVIDGLTLSSDDPFGTRLEDIRLTVAGGEIVGIAGVAGNGQKELLAALSGEHLSPGAGAIQIAGRPAGRLGPVGRRTLGLAVVPEERIGRGAVGELDMADNALLTAYGLGLLRTGLIDRPAARRLAGKIIADYGVVCRGVDAEAASLSGGNMQKFIIGREIAQGPRLLIAAHPTWGVDVGAAAVIRKALVELCNGGAGVLIISEDLDELFEICDRIAVLSGGRLSTPVASNATDIEAIGLLMGGHGGRAGGADAA